MLERLLWTIDDVAWHVQHAAQRDALAQQLGRIEASLEASDLDAVERDRLAAAAQQARATLERASSV